MLSIYLIIILMVLGAIVIGLVISILANSNLDRERKDMYLKKDDGFLEFL